MSRKVGSRSTQAPKSATSWRDTLKIHPAADLFPLMSSDELRALGEDIKKNGLKIPVAVWRGKQGGLQLLDGRNRLDAMEAVGIPVRRVKHFVEYYLEGPMTWEDASEHVSADTDPYAYVVSANIHRRHLSTEQKRDLITKLIKATPGKPDFQIAKTIKVSPTTVGTVRREMEAKGDVSKLETRIDTKGRKQPSRKPETPESRARWVNKCAEKIERDRKRAEAHVVATNNIITSARDDIGATSVGELARKDAEIEQLRNDKHMLEIKVGVLEREIEEAKRELAKAKAERDRLIAAAAKDGSPPPAVSDPPPHPLDIPPYLRRAAS